MFPNPSKVPWCIRMNFEKIGQKDSSYTAETTNQTIFSTKHFGMILGLKLKGLRPYVKSKSLSISL